MTNIPDVKVVISEVQVNPQCAIRNVDVVVEGEPTGAHWIIVENTPEIAAKTAWTILANIALKNQMIISHPGLKASDPVMVDTEMVYQLKANPVYEGSRVNGYVLELQPPIP